MSRLKQIKAQQKQVRTPKKEHKKQTGLPYIIVVEKYNTQ